MSSFSIEGFAQSCKEAMASAEDRMLAAKTHLEQVMAENSTESIVEVLEAAIPAGADIGEMIVHLSPELTMLYARLPPRFQSGIHNHTVFACIGQLVGDEKNVFYELDSKGDLKVVAEVIAEEGGVITLAPDAIHCIENPKTTGGKALHLYGGDFKAVMDRRSLWTSQGHERRSFSFELLMRESVNAMRLDGNTAGLNAIVEAIPSMKKLVDAGETPS